MEAGLPSYSVAGDEIISKNLEMDNEFPDENAPKVSSVDIATDGIRANSNVIDDIPDKDTPESLLLLYARTGNLAEMKTLLSSSVVDANAVSEKEAASQG